MNKSKICVKRVLSLLLAAIMAFSLMGGATALAVDSSDSEDATFTITRSDGTSIYLTQDSTVYSSGAIETAYYVEVVYPSGTAVTINGDGKNLTTISSIDTVVSQSNTDVDLTDGRHIDMPFGGTVRKNGSLESEDLICEVFSKGNAITLAEGGYISGDGELISIKADQSVTVGGTTITLPTAGGDLMVDRVGNITVPKSGLAIDGRGNMYQLTYGGIVYNPSGHVKSAESSRSVSVPYGSYSIYNKASVGGEVWISQDYAEPGTLVTISASPAKGYDFNYLMVTYAESNGRVETTQTNSKGVYTFIMPDSAVRVHASFVKGAYTVSGPTGLTGGTVSADSALVTPNTSVTVTAKANDGYVLSRLSVVYIDDDDEEVVVPLTRVKDRYTFTFTMPSADVSIYAAFAKSNGTLFSTDNSMSSDGTFVGDTYVTDGPYYGLADVLPANWYYVWMSNAIYRGYIDAQRKSYIDANGLVSRAEAAFTITRLMAGQNYYSSLSALYQFSDVGVSTGYSNEISYTLDKGYMIGTSDNMFSPNSNLTREQFALILYRIFGQYFVNTSHKSLNQFADAENIAIWAKDAVQWAVDNNLMIGTGTGLSPKTSVTRAEMATLVMRIALVLENKGLSGVVAPVTPVAGVPVPVTIDTTALNLGELVVYNPYD